MDVQDWRRSLEVNDNVNVGQADMAIVSKTISGIVTTKLTPPRASYSPMPRKELVESLGVDAPQGVALICAPAGYGKTTLASLYVESVDLPCAWLSLDPSDNKLTVFFAYLIASIESASSGPYVHCRAGLAASHEMSGELLADCLIRDLTDRGVRLVLVLDDYHVIQDFAIHRLLSRLVKRMPAMLQIVIVTRMDPPLPLSRLRGQGALVEIRSKQLRFSPAESETYLRKIGTLPSSILTTLVKKSEGWPAGLNLLALSASMYPGAYAPSAEPNVVGSSLIADYFLEEVLRAIPKQERLLLFSTALPDRFSLSVCQVLAHELDLDIDVHEWLTRIANTNLFVRSLDPYRKWYNYHQLFREFLLIRLHRTQSVEAISQLYRCLSDWFYEHQYVEEALRHALAAGDARRAAEIVENQACMVMAATDWRRLGAWLDQLPESVRSRSAVQVCFGYQMHFHHLPAVAERHFNEAEAALSEQQNSYTEAQIAEIQGSIWAMRAQIIAAERPLEAQEMAKRALKALPERCQFQRSTAEVAICIARFLSEPVRMVVADIQTALNELHNSLPSLRTVRLQLMVCAGFYQEADLVNFEQAAQELLKLSDQTELSFGRGWAEYALGWICYQRNDLNAAERYFLAVWENHDLYHGRAVIDALTGLVLIYRLQSDEHRRTEALAWLEQYVRRHNLAQGITVAKALRWMSDSAHVSEPPPQEFVVNVHEQLYALLWLFPVTIAIRRYVALGGEQNIAAAAELVDECLSNIYAQRDIRIVVEMRCCQALLFQAQGKQDLAVECLEEAVRFAARRGTYRLIADAGRGLKPLLQRLLARRIEPEFVAHVLSLSGSPALAVTSEVSIPPVPSSAPRPDNLGSIDLTPRELEVLLLLSERLSDKEIAAHLALSTRTVQKHTANIYQKLHVKGRRQAVTKAQAAGLIAQNT